MAHLVHVYALDETVQLEVTTPTEVQQLVEQFEDIFTEPKSLPPRRVCDHRIPLMSGAQPVNMRAYRHKPELKSEIERQVDELLASGIIQQFLFPSHTGEEERRYMATIGPSIP